MKEKSCAEINNLEKLQEILSAEGSDPLLQDIWENVHAVLKVMPYVKFLTFSENQPTENDRKRLNEMDDSQEAWKPDVKANLAIIIVKNAVLLFFIGYISIAEKFDDSKCSKFVSQD